MASVAEGAGLHETQVLLGVTMTSMFTSPRAGWPRLAPLAQRHLGGEALCDAEEVSGAELAISNELGVKRFLLFIK